MRVFLRPCCLVLVLGCSPAAPAKHPDHGKVEKAHLAWCEMLAKNEGEKLSSWRHREGCKAAYPTASSAFLERFNRCYGNALKEYGENAPDSGALIDECSHKILGGADPGDVSHTTLYKARCGRQERCQKVSADVCAGAWTRLDGFTQSLLSSKYNLGAQAEIAACLDDRDCEEDDAAVESACYEEAHAKLVWLPLSLGHDSSLGPKTD